MNKYVEEFRHSVAAHGEAIAKGESASANSAFELAEEAFKAIVLSGKDEELLQLYDDPDPWVQYWAASYTLEISENQALEKLRRLEASNSGLVSVEAEYSIKEWNLGEMRVRKRLGVWKD